MEPILMISELKKDFPRTRALRNVTLNLNAGEIFGLTGPNGAGKSTFLKILAGLIKPSFGSIKVFGKEINALNLEDKQNIGFTADEFSLYDHMTVDEIIRFNRGFYKNWDNERCRRYLKRFDLPLNERVKTFSRGMKIQLSLVLALVPMPRLLLLDEPLEGLDPIKRMDFVNLILEDFMDHNGHSIIMSSHYLEEVERISSQIGFMKDGTLIKTVSTDHLKGEEKTMRVVFQRQPPAYLLEMPGIKKVERESDLCYLFTIIDNFTAIYESCSKVPHFVLDVYHRNLEEIFKDYIAPARHGNGGDINDF